METLEPHERIKPNELQLTSSFKSNEDGMDGTVAAIWSRKPMRRQYMKNAWNWKFDYFEGHHLRHDLHWVRCSIVHSAIGKFTLDVLDLVSI